MMDNCRQSVDNRRTTGGMGIYPPRVPGVHRLFSPAPGQFRLAGTDQIWGVTESVCPFIRHPISWSAGSPRR